jgi:ADP-heptose:LPS heptosyltransferase
MSAGWDAAGRVLAVRLDAMGDVLMTGPAVRALAEGGRRVTLLTSRSGAAAAELLPGVADVIVYDAPWMKASAARSAAPDRAMIDRLRAGRFDAAVVFTVYSQNPLPAAMLCLLADVPLRLAHCRENPYHLLTDWVRETEPEAGVRHEVRRQLDLLAAVGVRTADERMRVTLPAEAVAHVRQTVRWLDLDDGRPWAVVHPGATAPSRRYPPGLFAEACRRLARAHGVRLVFTGDAGERPLVDEVREAIDAPTESLAGELDLAARLEQHRAGAPGVGRRHAGGGPVRAHQPAAHAVAGAEPGAQPRRAVPVVLPERLPGGAPRLPAAGRAGRGGGGCAGVAGGTRSAPRRG